MGFNQQADQHAEDLFREQRQKLTKFRTHFYSLCRRPQTGETCADDSWGSQAGYFSDFGRGAFIFLQGWNVNFFFFSFISQINFCRARGVFSLVLWFKFLVSAASDSSYFRFFILFVAMDYLNKMCREEKCPFFLLNTESISFLLKTCKLINAQKYLYARNLIIHPTNLVNS